MALGIMSAVSGLISPIVGAVQKRNDNATLISSIKEKAAAASVEADAKVTLSQAEWRIMGLKMSGGSLKDEWLCLVFSIPLFAGLIPGTDVVAHNVIELLGQDGYRNIMFAIVGASFGTKIWRGK